MFNRNKTLNQNVPYFIESEWVQVYCCLGLKPLSPIHIHNSKLADSYFLDQNLFCANDESSFLFYFQ